MTSPLSDPMVLHALSSTLVHFVWQGAVVAAVLAIARCVVRSSRRRYAMCVAALASCVLFPLITYLSAVSPAAVRPAVSAPRIEVGSSPALAPAARNAASSMHRAIVATVSRAPSLGARPAAPIAALQRHGPLIVLVWAFGVALMTARLVSGCRITRRLRRLGVSPLPAAWETRVQQLAHEVGLRRGVEVIASAIAAVPMVVGVLRPVVLIPIATLMSLTQEQLEAILIHEFVHVRRHDGLVISLSGSWRRCFSTILRCGGSLLAAVPNESTAVTMPWRRGPTYDSTPVPSPRSSSCARRSWRRPPQMARC